MVGLAGVCVSTCFAQPAAISPHWSVSFPAAANGNVAESAAVPVSNDSLFVVVVAAGSDAANLKLQLGGRSVPVKVVGVDPVSRLAFIKADGGIAAKAPDWAEDSGVDASATLQSLESAGPVKCQTTGWVKQVGGKILPLALLRVNFSKAVPPPGTPLADDSGRIVGIVFQSSGSGNIGYVIPSEAVRRVQQDICSGGQLNRGWLGLALRAESQTPQISRVLPDSPAAAAGIRPNDVLISIGARQVADYADAANAFFYLIPGRAVRVKLQRDTERLEFTLTPTKPKG